LLLQEDEEFYLKEVLLGKYARKLLSLRKLRAFVQFGAVVDHDLRSWLYRESGRALALDHAELGATLAMLHDQFGIPFPRAFESALPPKPERRSAIFLSPSYCCFFQCNSTDDIPGPGPGTSSPLMHRRRLPGTLKPAQSPRQRQQKRMKSDSVPPNISPFKKCAVLVPLTVIGLGAAALRTSKCTGRPRSRTRAPASCLAAAMLIGVKISLESSLAEIEFVYFLIRCSRFMIVTAI